MQEHLIQYGAGGLMAAIFLTGLYILDKRYNSFLNRMIKEKDTQLHDERAARVQEAETIVQLIRNQNRLIENQNDLMKGFIEISASFKALVNVMVDRR